MGCFISQTKRGFEPAFFHSDSTFRGRRGLSNLRGPSPILQSQSLLNVSNYSIPVLKSSLGHRDLLRESAKGEKTHLPTDSYEEWLTSQIVKGVKPSKKKPT
jgi:hypothetical protein